MTAARHEYLCETASADATFALGERLGRSFAGGLTIGLVGPLGAGKTHLVKGIAAGNATDWKVGSTVDDVRNVTSPTFTLVHEYAGRLILYHVDAYRLRGSHDLVALGFEELSRADTVVVVEWADRVRGAVGEDALWIELQVTDDTRRAITFHATGAAAQRCLNRVRDTLTRSTE